MVSLKITENIIIKSLTAMAFREGHFFTSFFGAYNHHEVIIRF